jgi:molybdate transport system permease protein
MDTTAAWLTLRLAATTTLLLAVIGLPLAWWLAGRAGRGGLLPALVEGVCTLPLVLPPTVMGFFLLVASAPESVIGRAWHSATGGRLPFTFTGILLAALITNLPFAVRPFTAAFAALDRRLVEASWCLGESRGATFLRVVIPACWPGIVTGLVMTFAHVVGEFGVVLMVGGNIPGVTRTLSVALYDDVQALDHVAAAKTASGLVGLSLLALLAVHLLARQSSAAPPRHRGLG